MVIFDLDEKEEDLINKAAEEMGITDQNEEVLLKPLGRFGKSGAKLFVIHVHRSRGSKSLYRVVKLDTVEKIVKEKKRTKLVAHDFDLRPEILYDSIRYSKKNNYEKAFILYKIEGDQELKDLLNSCIDKNNDMSFDLTKLKKALIVIKAAMKELPYPSTTPRYKQVRNEFKDYLRDEAGFEKIKQYANHDKSFPYIIKDDVSWEQLIDKIEKFLNSKIGIKIGAVHGDFHPSNIMIKKNTVSLIDFAWAKKYGITAIDYAMMENSIHYMWAPCWLPEYFWDEFDKYSLKDQLLHEKSKAEFLKFLAEEEYLNKWGQAIWEITKIVRSSAKAHYLNHKELLAARAALLIGQADFEDYPPVRVGAQLWRLLEAWEKQG